MGRYAVRRLLHLIPVFLGTTAFIHWLVWSVPGDPFASLCGDRRCPDAYVAAMTARYRLDDPWPAQYLHYLGNLLTGDFGRTFGGREISDVIAAAYPNTLKLAVVAVGFEAVVGITAGVVTGLRRNGFLDNLVLVSTLFLLAVPAFVLCFTLQFLLGVRWGLVDPTVSPGAPPHELLLPGFILGTGSMAYVARLTRTGVAENQRADYIRTAVAKGLPRRRVVGVHLLRNSLISVVTFLGIELGNLLGGAIVVEGIFGINGVGGEVYRAILIKEGSTVVGLTVVLVLAYLLMNLLVDLLYAAVDPRIRYD